MSWSGGPVPGGAYQHQQYQHQPPYSAAPPIYGQQQTFQHGQQQQLPYGQYPPASGFPQPGPPHRPHDVRPPKKKGNPIITRYPPPPGYRGPAQPQGPYPVAQQQQPQFQPPRPSFSHQPTPNPNFPHQNYGHPPTQGYSGSAGPPFAPPHAQQPYPPNQNNHWPTHSYSPNTGYLQGQHQPPHGYPSQQTQAHNQPYPPPPITSGPHQNYGQPPSGWSQHGGTTIAPPKTQYNSHFGRPVPDPHATPTPATVHLTTTQPTQNTNQPTSATSEKGSIGRSHLYLAWDEWDFDFEGAIWPKSNEPVDPSLSLGVIIWHPAKQMTRALPATFAEAEEQDLKPTPEKLDNGESVSIYFTTENSHEAFLDVRQTEDWDHIKDDPIFVVFTDEELQKNLVSLDDCIAQRDRPDEDLEDMSRGDQEMCDAPGDIMGDLEHALSFNSKTPGSFASTTKAASTEERQEHILAMLGVTGAPKPPSGEHVSSLDFQNGKASVTVPEQSNDSTSRSDANVQGQLRRAASYANDRTATGRYGRLLVPPPPPPPLPEHHRYDPWNAPNNAKNDSKESRASPMSSGGSTHTLIDSEIGRERGDIIKEEERDIKPMLSRDNSLLARKRSYEDADHDSKSVQQYDDNTKRKRRSHVDTAYSRR